MSDKSGLCMWCGRWTETRAEDGLADCDRPDCIINRDYDGLIAEQIRDGRPLLVPKTIPSIPVIISDLQQIEKGTS